MNIHEGLIKTQIKFRNFSIFSEWSWKNRWM